MITNKKILKLNSRKKIYQTIYNNPGLNFREISRRTNIPISTVGYHLKILKKSNLITIKSDIKFKRYYISNRISNKDKEILNIIRNKTARNILVYLGFYAVGSQKEISKVLGVTDAHLIPYIGKLKELGLISSYKNKEKKIITSFGNIILKRKKNINELLYYISDREYLTNLIIHYKVTLTKEIHGNELMEFIDEIFNYFQLKNNNEGNVNNFDMAVNSAIDIFFEFMPIPFCA